MLKFSRPKNQNVEERSVTSLACIMIYVNVSESYRASHNLAIITQLNEASC